MRKKKKVFTPLAAIIILLAAFLLKDADLTGTVPGYYNDTEIVSVEAPYDIDTVKSQGIGSNRFIFAKVTRVVDGDTLEIQYKSKEYKVRLLDVDTPESVKPGVEEQAYSKTAFEFTESIVLNKDVKLVFEKGVKDRYQRLLAHVVLDDGSYLNGMLVRNGFARVEIVSPNSKMSEYFYSLQDVAVQKGAGLWGLPEEDRPFVKNSKGKYVARYKETEKAS
ncbi:micrococcal nuclease [Anaerobacterium chartisolvens]|uniref:Micrococcal nuclease n=1 Tax=Anaerobacterium chartisolvens TaxID=1297424 RepID=A0A369AIS6_9FIRM|nr:thermonuclease family protein [Anaerobacterium chartisolvens]RCX09071.1 micrococcal nuclease [Anaerobacterium chartisolvens]